MDQPAIPWEELAAMLRRRMTLALSVFAVGVAAVLTLTWLSEPTYQASAKLMVTSERPRIAVSPDASQKPTLDRVTEQDLNSEVALLQSADLVREMLEPYRAGFESRTAASGNAVSALLRLPLDLPRRLYRRLHQVPPASPFEEWAAGTAKRVAVSPISKSNLIEVSFTAASAPWAAEFVNALVSRHVERHVRLNQQSETRRFFETQRDLVSAELRRAEDALRAFYAREHVAESVPEQRALLHTRLADVELALSNAQTEIAEQTARLEFLHGEMRSQPRHLAANPGLARSDSLQLVKGHLLSLEIQRSELLSKFAPNSLKVQDVERQIADAKRLLAGEQQEAAAAARTVNPAYQALSVDLAHTQAQLVAMQARAESLQAQAARHRQDIAHFDRIASEQARLEQEVATAKESFLVYRKKEEEARFSDALDESKIVNVSVVESARVPAAPMPSKALMQIIVGALLSLLAGVSLAFVRDRVDPTVKSAAEARALTDLPVLAEIPT